MRVISRALAPGKQLITSCNTMAPLVTHAGLMKYPFDVH